MLLESLRHVVLNERQSLLLMLSAVVCVAFGLALDLLSLYFWRERQRQGRRGAVGLPLVPWMVYFLGSFFWMMHGDYLLALVSLIVLTIWHVKLHLAIQQSNRKPSPR